MILGDGFIVGDNGEIEPILNGGIPIGCDKRAAEAARVTSPACRCSVSELPWAPSVANCQWVTTLCSGLHLLVRQNKVNRHFFTSPKAVRGHEA